MGELIRPDSKKFLNEVTGRTNSDNLLPGFPGLVQSYLVLRQRPVNEQDAFLDTIVSKADKEWKHVMASIGREKLARDFFIRDHSTIKNAILATLEKEQVAVSFLELDRVGKITGYFWVEGSQPYIQYNGLETLIHEVEHYLQWIDGGLMVVQKRSKVGDISEIYAKMASLKAIARYGSGPGMWQTYTRDNEPPKQALETFTAALKDEIYFHYSNHYPFILQGTSPDGQIK